jgi:hypothetical protein
MALFVMRRFRRRMDRPGRRLTTDDAGLLPGVVPPTPFKPAFPPDKESPVPRFHTLIRTIAVATAVVAVAAPVAAARPIDTPKAADHASPSAKVQDLRHLKAGQIQTSSLAGTTSHTPSGELGPVYWSYDYEAPAPKSTAVTVDDGTPWTAIGLGVAGACLLVGGGAALAARTRVRARKPRIAA